MLAIPYKINSAEYSVFIVMEAENIERLKAYDPAQFVLSKLGESWNKLKIKEINIGFATKKDLEEVIKLCQEREPMKALRFLARGWKFKPKNGDNDSDYQAFLNQ